jgi:glycosyltransferase involved in cell wall biosynthesis
MIYLFYDDWGGAGGIATYIHALAVHLLTEKMSFQLVICENTPSPIADELQSKGISIYRQPRLPGDRWKLRKRMMLTWLRQKLKPGDWVFCVCQPEPAIYLKLVQLVHQCQAKIAVSWMFTPEFWPLVPKVVGSYAEATRQAIAETDAVVSVSQCSVPQYQEFYGYTGKVEVIPYHNLLFFSKAVPLPAGPPWKIGFIGRLDIQHKNLDTVLQAMAKVRQVRQDVELHLYGGGQDQETLEKLAVTLDIQNSVHFHGAYDHRHDLSQIVSACHFFIYPSRWEGGPCFSLLELTQAGRYCVATSVGGIPDLYAGHPDVGLLLESSHTEAIYQGLLQTLEKLEHGLIDGNKIRARYFDGFDMESAHRAWMAVIAPEVKASS